LWNASLARCTHGGVTLKNRISDRLERSKLPLKWLGQIILVLLSFFLLSRLVTAVSFSGMNKPETRATIGVSSQEVFDSFGFKVFDTKWNESNWAEVGTGSQIKQLDGVLLLSREVDGFGGLVAHRRKWLLSQINYLESRILLNRVLC